MSEEDVNDLFKATDKTDDDDFSVDDYVALMSVATRAMRYD
jgi:hypothetical protein